MNDEFVRGIMWTLASIAFLIVLGLLRLEFGCVFGRHIWATYRGESRVGSYWSSRQCVSCKAWKVKP